MAYTGKVLKAVPIKEVPGAVIIRVTVEFVEGEDRFVHNFDVPYKVGNPQATVNALKGLAKSRIARRRGPPQAPPSQPAVNALEGLVFSEDDL